VNGKLCAHKILLGASWNLTKAKNIDSATVEKLKEAWDGWEEREITLNCTTGPYMHNEGNYSVDFEIFDSGDEKCGNALIFVS